MLTPDEIRRIQAARDRAVKLRLPDLHDVVHEVCELMGVTVADVKAYNRADPLLVEARKQVIAACHRRGHSVRSIARIMGRDRASILHAIRAAGA